MVSLAPFLLSRAAQLLALIFSNLDTKWVLHFCSPTCRGCHIKNATQPPCVDVSAPLVLLCVTLMDLTRGSCLFWAVWA